MLKLKLLIGVIFAFGLLWVLGAAALAQGETPAPYAGQKNPYPWADNVTQAAGQAIYQTSCRGCHGATGSNIDNVDFSTSRYSNDLIARQDYYFWAVSEGRLDKGMPAYKSNLSEAQRWQVLAYIWGLGAGPIDQNAHQPEVIPQLEHGALPDCFRCHTRSLRDGHDKFGAASAGCLTCHSSTRMGKLHLFDGTDIERSDSPKLCGQCHSDKYDAWQKGTHGTLARNTNGSGIPTNVKPRCADCHDPHQPKMSVTGTSLPSLVSTKGGKLDCLSCHVRALKGHDKLGTGSAACWACHLSTEMTTLHLSGQDTGFPLADSVKLCAQCHQKRYQDWVDGTHGVPAWKEGEPAIFGSEKVRCTNCHDPHQPQIPLLNITKPHPAPTPDAPAPPLQLLAVVGISLALTTAVGIAVTRGGRP